MKGTVKAFCAAQWKAMVLTVLAAVVIFAAFTAHDELYLKHTIQDTFVFMGDRLVDWESCTANDEVKSLVHLLDKAAELSRVVQGMGGPDQTVMEQYRQEQRLYCAAVLDGDMNLVMQAGGDVAAQWGNLLNSSAVRDIPENPKKVYFSRTEADDGETYDVAAAARQDAPGVVFVCIQKSVDAEGEELALNNLFSGFTFDMKGIVAMSDGENIVSSNHDELTGKTMQECYAMYRSGSLKANTVTRLRSGSSIWYGSKARVRSYDLYVLFPAAQVFRTRTFVVGCSVIIMIMGWLLMIILQGRTERDTLEQSQKRLRIINALGTAYSAIMLVQLEERTVEVYRSTQGNYENYSAPMGASSQAKQINRLAAPEYRETLLEFSDINTIAQRMQGHNSLSYTWRTMSGDWMTSIIVPQRWNENGKLIAVLIANRDVTEEKQRELETQAQLQKTAEDARRANAAKTDFLRRMSHDIRTPINGIRGMVEISRHYAGDEVKQEECRQKIMDASGFLLDLVNNVLDMNKLESGEIQLDEIPFELEKLVRETNSVIEIQASERGVALHDHGVKAEHTHFIGSPVHLRQVIQNIESNAVKYTPEGGSVTVSCREVAAENGIATLEFVCTDTGIGMSKEFQQRAFEPFVQENTSARTAYLGTGLGLAITKELVERMGGTIDFQSRQGKGTTFVVQLPLRIDASACAPQQAGTAQAAGTVQGAKVLLVEDNDLNMEIAQFLLESEGAEVTQAWNGREAVELFAASAPGSYDVILMDIMMPVMGGLEAARVIRAMKRPDAATVPIFAMTANAFQDDIQRSRAAGMNEHLTKPLDARELMAAIVRYRRVKPQKKEAEKAE